MDENHVIVPGDNKAQPVTQTVKAPVTTIAPSITTPVMTDTIVKAVPGMTNGVFTHQPDKPHSVILIFDKVDGVYVNEARNAFVRYNREKYYNQPISLTKDALDPERALLVFSIFEDADAAMAYYDKIKRAAPAEIGWLQPTKYSFLIITESNLQLLKSNKDVNAYKALLNTQYNGKF
jgi:hypothetical protein